MRDDGVRILLAVTLMVRIIILLYPAEDIVRVRLVMVLFMCPLVLKLLRMKRDWVLSGRRMPMLLTVVKLRSRILTECRPWTVWRPRMS